MKHLTDRRRFVLYFFHTEVKQQLQCIMSVRLEMETMAENAASLNLHESERVTFETRLRCL